MRQHYCGRPLRLASMPPHLLRIHKPEVVPPFSRHIFYKHLLHRRDVWRAQNPTRFIRRRVQIYGDLHVRPIPYLWRKYYIALDVSCAYD